MKFAVLALLAAVASAGVLTTHTAWERHLAAVVRGVDDEPPPPVDCPFCGGNAALHLKTMRKMLALQSQLVLATALAR